MLKCSRVLRIAPLLVVSMLLGACAFTTANVELDYQPAADSKTPLGALPAQRIALRVDDQRPVAERDRIGMKKNGYGMETAKVVSTRDVTGVLREAIQRELQGGGHTVTESAANADVVLTATLKRYYADTRIRFLDVEMSGFIDTDLIISDPVDEQKRVSVPLNASYREGKQLVLDSTFGAVLNRTLAEYMRSFARETALLEALGEPRARAAAAVEPPDATPAVSTPASDAPSTPR
jgi:hypothetical protein